MTTINIRIDPKLKNDATKTLSYMGTDVSSAVKIFLNQLVLEKGFPFKPTIDTKKLKAELDKERDWALKYGKRYDTAEEAMAPFRKIYVSNSKIKKVRQVIK